ncbi:glutamate ABC transporter substrate-binding protein [Streptomyces sp. GbtcB6]|uniref:glutamate ABC transporter substrate-binding protein n=1 Tax=Streptomyces sp. GbtcB6 TaxID=2824751 RepID=UPI0027E3C8C4|nr:glutamate ABC transporter substrate-binding protein [Streptomyces sp. GbtcB6]
MPGPATFRHRLLPAVVASLAAMTLAVSCADSSAPHRRSPAAKQAPAESASAGTRAESAETGENCDRLRSLKPPDHMPEPGGRMPSGTAMERIVARGRLIVGVDQNNYLFGYRDSDTGQLSGLDIDLVREISRALFGRPDRVQFKTVPSARRIEILERGEVDLVAHSMTITCERMERVLFSSDYLDSGQRVLVPDTSPVKNLADLAGQKVCTAKGSTSLDELRRARPKVRPVAVADWTDCLVLLQLGAVAAVSTTDNVLAGLSAQDPTTRITGPRFTYEPHGIAVAKKSPELVRFVNGVLARLRSTGRLRALHERWLGTYGDFYPPAPRYRA